MIMTNNMNSTEKENINVKRPSFFWLLTEAGRALAETGISYPYRKFFANEECGDGHPILVLPGFLASDMSTSYLRKYLDNIGYVSYGWNLGRNSGREDYLYELEAVLSEIYETHGEKVSIIGWSLGGVYARQLSKMQTNKVRQVITLASPFRGISKANNVAWIYNLITGGKRVADVDSELLLDIPKPTPVPTTSIYSKQDGVVPWAYCMEEKEDAIHQNIEVRGSHLGMANNPSVLKIITNRLQYSRENWEYFYPENVMEDLLLYPSFR